MKKANQIVSGMPALNVASPLMGVMSLCNIWLRAILGCAELCFGLDLRMRPDSWEAEAVSRHTGHHQCFMKVCWGMVACLVRLGLPPVVPDESLVNTSVSSLCDYNNCRI